MILNIKKFDIALAKAEMNTADLARATGYSLNYVHLAWAFGFKFNKII